MDMDMGMLDMDTLDMDTLSMSMFHAHAQRVHI